MEEEVKIPEFWKQVLLSLFPWAQPFDEELLNKLKEDVEQNGM